MSLCAEVVLIPMPSEPSYGEVASANGTSLEFEELLFKKRLRVHIFIDGWQNN